VARFVRLVFRTPALQPCYLDRARRYLATIERHAVAKWYRSWHTERGSGEALSDFGGWRGLPLNQSLVFGELLLTLGGPARSPLYDRECPEVPLGFYSCLPDSMAVSFSQSLLFQPESRAYAWRYAPGARSAGDWEDLSHASLDLSFTIAAAGQRSSFSAADLDRFANTLTDVMWNGSTAQPWFSRYVSGAGVPDSTGNLGGWLRLAEGRPRVFQLISRVMLADTVRLSPSQTSSAVALVTALLAEMQSRFPDEVNPSTSVDEGAAPGAMRPNRGASIVRGELLLPWSPVRNRQSPTALQDIAGRKVMDLRPGPNDVSHLPPGIYFVRMADAEARRASARVVIQR
jgi:hypothetical protein